jgi:DUF4097 and DUF4098 domain-containing protein YvlB
MRTSLSLSIFVASALLADSMLARAWNRTADQQIAADPRGIVEVSNFAGKIEVSGWDEQKVLVQADVSNDVTNVDVRGDHGRTSITVRLHGFYAGGEAHLRIKIPRGSELDVTSVSGDVTTTGVTGMQRLKTVSGSITADFAQADVEAKTVSGDVALRGEGKAAELHVSSISGSIRVARGAGDLEATTVSGALDAQLDPGRSVRARTTSGRMVIDGKLGNDADFDLQTVSGDIRLHAGAAAGYDYEVSTFSGSIENCFNAQAERTSRYGPGERLIGTRGKGDAHVRIKTMSGGIDLCDKS